MTARIDLVAALLALLSLPAIATAQQKGGSVVALRAKVVAAAPRGGEFRSAGQEYRIVPTIRAAKATGGAATAAAPTALNAGQGTLLERKGPYGLYVSPTAESAMAASGTAAVALNLRSGQLGVITGTITARVPSAAAAQAAATEAGLTLELVSPSSGYAFFRAAPGADAIKAAAALRARPGMKGVEAEVREAYDEPQ
jgi:hypothetical protein